MYNLSKHQAYKYLKDFLKSVSGNRFSDFIFKIESAAVEISENHGKYYDYGIDSYSDEFYDKNNKMINEQKLKETVSNKVKGDMLEIFCSFFLQYVRSNNCFGIAEGTYEFNNDETDIGCDGYGTLQTNGEKAFIQVKYRNNPVSRPFNKEVFCGLFTDAILNFGMDYNNQNQRLVFFTNLNVGTRDSWNTRTGNFNNCVEKCKIPVIIIGKHEIENITDGSEGFWKEFSGALQ